MLQAFENCVRQFVESNGLIPADSKVLLAVSGGADSLALLYCLGRLKACSVLPTELAVAHINHQLRGVEADEDAEFVLAHATKLGLPVTIRRIDVRGVAERCRLSIETAARKQRIEALTQIARQTGCKLVATGHTKNDNAETLLQRLQRGTGLCGLAGIWPKRVFGSDVTFIRPLLGQSRHQVMEYLSGLKLDWRQDRTNVEMVHRRNYIRYRLLPLLQGEASGSLVELLAELAQRCHSYCGRLRQKTAEAWRQTVRHQDKSRVEFDAECFRSQMPWVRVELVRKALQFLGSGEQKVCAGHYDKALALAGGAKGPERIDLPNGVVVCRSRSGVVFMRPAPAKNVLGQAARRGTAVEGSVVLPVPGRARLGGWQLQAEVLEAEGFSFDRFRAQKSCLVECFDLDKLVLPLQVRGRKAGDRFRPFGLPAVKKVGKFLNSAGVEQSLRDRLLIVSDAEKIIWVAPVRPSDTTKVDTRTRKIVLLSLLDLSPPQAGEVQPLPAKH
jgi:tRNA(Ile)-lysidine synthase